MNEKEKKRLYGNKMGREDEKRKEPKV